VDKVMKKKKLWFILGLIFPLIFNIFFFVLGGREHNASVWISYSFIHFAYFMLIQTRIFIRKGKSATVFGFSLYSISSVYFLIVFVIGIFFILISPLSHTAALLIQLFIMGLYGIIFISNIIANEHTRKNEKKRSSEIVFVKEASAKLKNLLEKINDKESKKKVERVYDAVYSSPVKSHYNLTEIEDRMLHSIDALENEVSAENNENITTLANSLLNQINERNVRLKLLPI